MAPLPTGRLDGAELFEAALPLVHPYRSGRTALRERNLLLVRLTRAGSDGWGECGPVPGYSPETLEECRGWLEAALASLAGPAVAPPGTGPATARFAVAAALADLDARREGVPLWRRLGGTRDRVEAGAVIGLDPPDSELPALAEGLAAEGYRRIKLKVDADRGPDRVAAVRRALPSHDLAVDANGTLDPDRPEAVAAAYDRFGLSFVEQPFPAAALAAHADLADLADTPVCLDESITDPPTARRALEMGAAGVLNVKPARLGGLEEAVAVHRLAVSAGVPAWCGGMVESGIGKAAALAVASLPGMRLPADLPPSSRHFAADLSIPPWVLSGGALALPAGPGAGVAPDPAMLARHARRLAAFGTT